MRVKNNFYKKFQLESNQIEGINSVTQKEIDALAQLVFLDELKISDVEAYVKAIQPNAQLRLRSDQIVYVGDHMPPIGGQHILYRLDWILVQAVEKDPFETHVEYETLHPFTDGNGRSGRAIWLWQMRKQGLDIVNGFLHTFYYQSLRRQQQKEMKNE